MRTKRALYNFLTDFFPLILITLIGLLKLKLINVNLGEELSGMNTLYVNIMTYLSIMDGGLASALIFRLYKPIADSDTDKISALVSGGKRIFNLIGAAMLVIGIVVSFFVFFFFKREAGSTITYSYMQTTFLIYLISSVIPYLVVVNKSLFEAGQRKYVTNMVLQSFMIFKSIVEIILLMNGYGLIEMYLLLAFCNIASSIIIYFLSKRAYPEINFKAENKDYGMLGDVKNLLIHKIGTMVAYNIDSMIIGVVLGMAVVPFYTAYQYITDNLMTMIGKITYSVTAGVGDLLARDKKRAFEVFNELNNLSFFIASIVCVPLVLVINQFIDVWQPGLFNTNWAMAICFVLQLFYYVIRMPPTTYTNAAGLFKETRLCPIIECAVNLTLSLTLINIIGLPGVLIATFIAYLVSDYFIKPRIIYHQVFDEKVMPYYGKNLLFIALIIILSLGFVNVLPFFDFSGYLSWFVSSCILFILNFVIVFAVYKISGQANFMNRVFDMIKRRVGKA